MSENIQSISQGTCTIGQTSATNFVAGTGIKIDEPSAGTVRIGNDETVLYSVTGQPEALATWNLSDNPNNFEKLEITYQTYPEGPHGNKIGICPCINDCYSLDNVFYNSVAQHYYWMFWQLSSTNNQMNLTKGGYRQIDSALTAVTNETTLRIYKVIGINRISGSNA